MQFYSLLKSPWSSSRAICMYHWTLYNGIASHGWPWWCAKSINFASGQSWYASYVSHVCRLPAVTARCILIIWYYATTSSLLKRWTMPCPCCICGHKAALLIFGTAYNDDHYVLAVTGPTVGEACAKKMLFERLAMLLRSPIPFEIGCHPVVNGLVGIDIRYFGPMCLLFLYWCRGCFAAYVVHPFPP